MAKICWVVSKIKRKKFTGGIYSILKHADGLAQLGHEVTVTPLQPSEQPKWFGKYNFRLDLPTRWNAAIDVFKSRRSEGNPVSLLHAISSSLTGLEPRVFSFPIRHSIMCVRAQSALSNHDITIATSFETALPVHLHGKGMKFYFAQHFEPLFCNEFDDPAFAESVANSSYHLPLKIITNSAWLSRKIYSETGRVVHAVAFNAIEPLMFNKTLPTSSDGVLRVISYGGRGAAWKGFEEMAIAVKKARNLGSNIEWSVYGDCSIPPENQIAPYKPLGFLRSDSLAEAYRKSQVLLSSSWYESFPLFPLEGMASGLAVITTQAGTEEFARHMETAWIVPPKDPDALCNALVSLSCNKKLRENLGAAGMIEAKKYTWQLATKRMEQILLETESSLRSPSTELNITHKTKETSGHY